MKNKTLIQLWIAIKIWIIAVTINTFAGSLFLNGFSISNGIQEYMLIGLAFSLLFSFPVFLTLFFIINRGVSHGIHPKKIFEYIFYTGMVLTVLVTLLFVYLLDIKEIAIPFFIIALVSCMGSTGSQYKSIFRLIPKTVTMIENFLE